MRDLKDPYQYTGVAAHLGVCPDAPPQVRHSVGDLAPEDGGMPDWARLRVELARYGRSGGPHLNPQTIHPPGACAMCDAYPDLQHQRTER